jgi:hypothetical protein
MHMLDRRSVDAERSGRRLVMAEDSEAAFVGDLETGFEADLVSTEGSGSTAGLGLVAVSDSAGAGDAALASDGAGVLASVGDGIRGGDGATRTIRIRTGEVMAGMAGTTILRRTVRT